METFITAWMFYSFICEPNLADMLPFQIMPDMRKTNNNKPIFAIAFFIFISGFAQSINAQNAPAIKDRAEQEIIEGAAFKPIALDNYVTDPDNAAGDIICTALSDELLVNIAQHTASIVTPNASWYGTDNVAFIVTDPESHRGTDEALFSVAAVNDFPVISNITGQTITSGDSFDKISQNSYVPDVDNPLSDLHGEYLGNTDLLADIINNQNATIEVPETGWLGTNVVNLTVRNLAEPAQTVTSNNVAFVVEKNQSAPFADNDDYTIAEGSVISTPAPGVLSNDTDSDGDLLSAHIVAAPVHAKPSFALMPNGSFLYEHDGSESASDAFTYVASDGLASSNEATVTIHITPVNDAPVITGISDQVINEGESFQNIDLNAVVSDAEDDDHLLSWSYSTTHDLTVGIDNSSHIASIAVPSPTWNGSETVTFTVTDTQSGTASDEASFTVSAMATTPTDIALTPSSIAENIAANSVVGTLSTTDADFGDSFTYSWATGGTDNSSFTIDGSQVKTNAIFDRETKSSYAIRIRSTDGAGLFVEKNMTVTVTNVNEDPYDITLSSNTLAENQAANTVIGTLTGFDYDAGDVLTLSLPGGVMDNNLFNISGGNQLRFNGSANFEAIPSYTVKVRVMDALNAYYEEEFIISVANVNETPTNIALSNTSVAENQPINTLIGAFTATDPDAGGSFTYSFVSGSNDNAKFVISGNQLQTGEIFDYETKISYTIQIRVTDQGSLTFDKSFSITINDLAENAAPTNITLSAITIAENQIANTVVGNLTTTDPNVGDNFTYSLAAGGTDNSSFNILSNQLRINAPFDFENKSSYAILIRSTDNGGLFFDKAFIITVNNVNETPTNITLSNTTIAENQPSNTVVGTLTTTDPDISDTYTYTLAAGGTDNAKFNILVNQLRTSEEFDFEVLSSYSIKIRSTDQNGLYFEKDFAISVTDVNEGTANITGGGVFCYGAVMPVTLNVTGGIAPFTLELTRSLSSSNKDTTISGISVATYPVYVKIPGKYVIKSLKDGNNHGVAFTTSPVTLTINPRAKATISPVSTTICNDGTTKASIKIDFSAGVAPYAFKVRRRGVALYDTTFTNVSADPFFFNARVVENTATRHRIIEILDVNNCPGDTASGSAWVSYKASPKATISGSASTCSGVNTTLTVTLTEGTTPWNFTYVKNGLNPVTVTGIISNIYTFQVNQSGTYTISAVSDQTCSGIGSGQAVITNNVLPTATLSGSATICQHTSTNLNVGLTGSSPWKFYYTRNLGDSILVENVASSPKTVAVSKAGTYTLYKVVDKNSCVGTVSDSATVTLTPAPAVTLSGLEAAYNKDVVRVPIYGAPTGGYFTYSGPSSTNPLITYYSVMHFWPVVAGVGTHQVIYNFQDPGTDCYGYDTAIVRVLEAQATISFEKNRTKYCTNDGPFTIIGVNVKNAIGAFSISGGTGLVDHGNNTATIYPKQLTANKYTITYTYYDGTPLSVTKDFDIGNKPAANFSWATECFSTGKPISFNNTSTSAFGYLTDTSYFWKVYTSTGFESKTTKDIVYTFSQAGNHIMELQIENSYGCVDTIKKTFPLRPTIDASSDYYENFETQPISWRSGNSESVTVNSWQLGNPSEAFSLVSPNEKCWYTKITSSAPPREQSWVTSPCYDFTNAQKPMIKMNIWRLFNLNTNADGANLQYSADSGKTWTLLGDMADGINWYNSYIITGTPGGVSIGWSNVKDADWVEARHSLDMLKGKSRVQFRITYGSDSRVRNTNGIAFDDIWIVDRNRMAFVEHFTNSSDSDSEVADSILDAFTQTHEYNVINIQYHTSTPAGDPFYTDNTQVPNLRQFYYGLSTVPYAILDGGTIASYKFDFIESSKPFNENAIILESLQPSKFQINMDTKIDNLLRTKIQIGAKMQIPVTNISVRIAIIERTIHHINGQNGDTVFHNVVKAMLPGPAGTTFSRSWNKDEVVEIEKTWELSKVYDVRELRVVAFIQNESTHEVYQVALDTIGIIVPDYVYYPTPVQAVDFTVYPNPARNVTTVEFAQGLNQKVKLDLFNNMGRLIYTTIVPAGEPSVEIPLENCPGGLYLLRLVSDEQLIGIRKLIVVR